MKDLQDSKDSKNSKDSNNSKNSNIYTFRLSNFTIYTKNKTLNIPKIDYIYFADSAICLREDFLSSIAKIIESKQTLESSILTKTQNLESNYIESNLQDSKENTMQNLDSKNHNKMPLEIIYFKIFNHFKNVETKDFIDLLLYNVEHEVSGFNVITRALTEEISDFSFSYDILINFKFLSTKNISFMENTLHYMKLFSALIIAQSNRIYVLPQNLVTQLTPKNTLEKLTDSITKNAKNKEFIAQSYLKMALNLSEFCKDSIESNPQDFIDSKDSKNTINSKQNFLDSILKQNLNTLFTHFYYIKALDLLECNPSEKTIKTLENLSQKLQNLKLLNPLKSQQDCLEYKLGKAITATKRNAKRALKLPFTLFKIIQTHKKAQKEIQKREAKYPFTKMQTQNLSQEIIESREFKLGTLAAKAYKNPLKFLALPITLPLLSHKIKKLKKKQSHKNENIIREIQLHKLPPNAPTLIINLADVGVGDYLGVRPLLPAIREHYADYEITFLGSHRYADIMLEHDTDYIDKLIYCQIRDSNAVFCNYKEFFASRFYDILLYPYTINDWFVHLTAIIKAKSKIENYTNPLFIGKNRCEDNKLFYTNLIYTTQNDIFEIYRYKQFFEILFNKSLKTPSIKIHLNENRFSKINFDFTKKYAVIFPGTTDIQRMYDIHNYATLAHYLYQKYGIISYIIGSQNEKPIAEKIANPHIINICGKYTLDEIAYILNKSALVLCNDSGGYHLSMCVCDNIIIISSGESWTRFVNYPPEFKAGKLVSTPLPRDVFSNPYYEYNFNNALLNSISPSDIITLIDTIHSKRF